MLDYTYATYRGANLSALAADILKIGAPVGTITSFKIKVHANVAADVEFTIKRNGSALTTVDVLTGADQGTSATISQACTEDDELVLDLTDYTSGTIQAPITLYVFYTRSVEASTTEQLTGTESAKFSTPDSVAALWEKGSDIASAGTISIGEGGFFHVTGTTTITDIDPATDKAGREFCLVFDGILTLTHHATTLILPTGANIVTAAGDVAIFRSEGSDAVRCVVYQRKDGTPLAGGGFTAASTTEVLTGTDSSKGVTPDALAALWEQGSDVASSGTISFGEGGYFNITGTTTITDIDFGTDKAGRTVWVKFAGALTLTHNGTSLILPGGANITTATGDTACFVSLGSDNVQCLVYKRASRTNEAADLQGTGLVTDAVGFRTVPINSQSAAYTTVAGDSGKAILHPTADNNARTFTIDSNANVAYPIGTAITFINQINTVTIAITSDTLTLMGAGTTGSRTLAANGIATALKVSTTGWIISGTNLT